MQAVRSHSAYPVQHALCAEQNEDIGLNDAIFHALSREVFGVHVEPYLQKNESIQYSATLLVDSSVP